MKTILLILAVTIISGCVQSGYNQFYHPLVDASTLKNAELLGRNEEPQIFVSNNPDQYVSTLRSKNYIPLGYSSFNGSYEDIKNASAQAKRIGATVVVINSEYTNTLSSTSALLVPNNQTTYHYGSVYGGGTNGGYSGTSTTYGTTVVPITTHHQRYDQLAVYLVKSTDKRRFGVYVIDLPPEVRSELQRNTGAMIDIVIEDTPAFYSNLFAGDVIVSIDGQPVQNTLHAIELMATVPKTNLSSSFLVIRNGEEKAIRITF